MNEHTRSGCAQDSADAGMHRVAVKRTGNPRRGRAAQGQMLPRRRLPSTYEAGWSAADLFLRTQGA
jgi:hypothetical protein